MLFNSRSVAFMLSSAVGVVTALILSLLSQATIGLVMTAFLVAFVSSFLFTFFTLEFLIFKEIRNVYSIFTKFRTSKSISTDEEDMDVPIKNISQELFSFANTKEQEIEKLKQLESFRREFLADISHELKTPVFSAQGFIHTLLDGAVEDLKVRDKFLNKAAKSLDDLDNLVQDLIAISQLETGEVKMQFENFNLAELVHDIFDQLEMKARRHHVSLSVDIKESDVYFVYADHYRISQVIKNLIDNAIKYAGEKTKVTVTLRELRDLVHITVEDNGVGIPVQHQDRVFQRFYRIDKSRSKEKGGTGLGLSIVKHIIEAHDSKIVMSSKEGKGTMFSFKLEKGVEQHEELEF